MILSEELLFFWFDIEAFNLTLAWNRRPLYPAVVSKDALDVVVEEDVTLTMELIFTLKSIVASSILMKGIGPLSKGVLSC